MNIVWFNGDITPGKIAIDAQDRGFLLGDGIFETIAVNNRKPLWLKAHLERMEKAAFELGIGFAAGAIHSGVKTVLESSTADFEVLRITLSRGKTSRGLSGDGTAPSLLITLAAFSPGSVPEAFRLRVSGVRRNEFAPSSRLKTLSYVDGIVAAREVAADADDALMLNTAGHVASTTVANIFLLQGNELITPGLNQGILPGITRRVLLDNAEGFGLKAVERVVEPDELFRADAVFLCNSLRFVRPVAQLDGKALGRRPIDNLKSGLRQLASP